MDDRKAKAAARREIRQSRLKEVSSVKSAAASKGKVSKDHGVDIESQSVSVPPSKVPPIASGATTLTAQESVASGAPTLTSQESGASSGARTDEKRRTARKQRIVERADDSSEIVPQSVPGAFHSEVDFESDEVYEVNDEHENTNRTPGADGHESDNDDGDKSNDSSEEIEAGAGIRVQGLAVAVPVPLDGEGNVITVDGVADNGEKASNMSPLEPGPKKICGLSRRAWVFIGLAVVLLSVGVVLAVVYLVEREPELKGEWNRLGSDIYGTNADDRFGHQVRLSADGRTLAASSDNFAGEAGNLTGHVRVFDFDETQRNWTQFGQDIEGVAEGDGAGYSLALSSDGRTVAVGSRDNDDNGESSGHVRIFFRTETNKWQRAGSPIVGEAAGDFSGATNALSLSGNGLRVAIGAFNNNGASNNGTTALVGHVRVFEYRADNDWVQLGEDIDGENSRDRSGTSVDLSKDGTIVAIGAAHNDDNGGNSGHVRVYNFTETGWVQMGQDIDGEASGDESGGSISLSADGRRLAVGAYKNDDNGDKSGQTRVHEFGDDGVWRQLGQDIDGEAEADQSGGAVDLSDDGTTLAVGAFRNDGNGEWSGHVRVFRFIDGEWTQIGPDIDGDAPLNESGQSVSLSSDGTTLAIGAPRNNGNGPKSGQVRVFELV